MSSFSYSLPVSVHITPLSPESLGLMIRHEVNSTGSSATWGTANKAVCVPFSIKQAIIVQRLFSCNGATAAGNIDIGIYTIDGKKIVSTGSTAQAGTTTVQSISITPTTIGPGTYYMALAASSTSTTFEMFVVTSSWEQSMMGIVNQNTAFPLPAAATFVTPTTQIPVFGLSQLTLI